MGIGHFDVFLTENIEDASVDLVVHIPVILGLDPNADHITDGAVTIAGQSGKGGGIGKHPIIPCRFQERADHQIRVSIVGCGDVDIYAACAGDGIVDDFCRNYSAVGDGSQLVIRCD